MRCATSGHSDSEEVLICSISYSNSVGTVSSSVSRIMSNDEEEDDYEFYTSLSTIA